MTIKVAFKLRHEVFDKNLASIPELVKQAQDQD